MTEISARAGAHTFGALSHDHLAHGYLFTGPEGSGKAHFAHQLAKAIFCDLPISPIVACDYCPQCKMVKAGTHPDLIAHNGELKIGAAGDTDTFDELTARSLVTRLSLHGYSGRWRIVVASDITFASPESANALLKLIEEPPAGVVFIFTASRPTSLLPTIVSRLVTIPFTPFTDHEIQTVLSDLGVPPDAAADATMLAGGNLDLALALIQNGESAAIRRGALHWFCDTMAGHNPDVTFLQLDNKRLTPRDKRIRLSAALIAIKQAARDWTILVTMGSDFPSLMPDVADTLAALENNPLRAKAALAAVSAIQTIARTTVPIPLVLSGLQYRLQIP